MKGSDFKLVAAFSKLTRSVSFLTRSVSFEVSLFCFQPQRGGHKPAQGNALGWQFSGKT
jgi:hypothetical protein